MKTLILKKYVILILVFCASNTTTYCQNVGYSADSLQVKVYTEIEYVKNSPKNVKVLKVFCDYCSDNQIAYIKEEAYFLTFNDRFNPENRMAEGKKMLALLIRISKEDFKAIKDE